MQKSSNKPLCGLRHAGTVAQVMRCLRVVSLVGERKDRRSSSSDTEHNSQWHCQVFIMSLTVCLLGF